MAALTSGKAAPQVARARGKALIANAKRVEIRVCLLWLLTLAVLVPFFAFRTASPNLHREEQREVVEASQLTQPTFNPILRHMFFSADSTFATLLNNHPNPSSSSVVIEVGCHRLAQSAAASAVGFKTISFDASPQNFAKMQSEYDRLPAAQKDLMTLKHNAVSDVSGKSLQFSAVGGTGDHVTGLQIDAGKSKYNAKPDGAVVLVETLALDDIIHSLSQDESVYLLKIDVQGHEAQVFKGLQKSIQAGRVRYILFEYWVDALDQTSGHPYGACTGVLNVLLPLIKGGYELFDLNVISHPKAGDRMKNLWIDKFYRPLDLIENCRWYSEHGEKDRRKDGGYEMGYWTDVLAVYKGEFGTEEVGQPLVPGKKPRNPHW